MATERVGLLRPLRVSTHGDFATGTGEELRKSQLRGIIGMRGTSAGILGELQWDHRRGNKLDALRNAALGPALKEVALYYCGITIGEFMPTERLIGFYVERSAEERALNIQLETKEISDKSSEPHKIITSIDLKI